MLTAVSCPSISLCLAVGNDTGDPSVGQAVPIDPTTATIVAGPKHSDTGGNRCPQRSGVPLDGPLCGRRITF